MSQKSNVFDRVFEPLMGLPCWQVMPGWGSFLTMEFGEPHLRIREPIPLSKFDSLRRRSVRIRGQWHFWLQECQWFVFTNSNLSGSWFDKDTRASAAKTLDGQKLIHANFDPATGSSEFEFDLGSRLETTPYDKEGVQWDLFEPSGFVLSYRFDGKVQYVRSNEPDDDTNWNEPD